MSCSSATPSSLLTPAVLVCPRVRHLVSGTFNSPFLHLLSFDTLTRTLSLLSTLPGYGPHSFLAVGRTAEAGPSRLVDTLYATTWAATPLLSAWRIRWHDQSVEGLEWLGNMPITATSSYVHVQPPPYPCLTTPGYGMPASTSKYLYSAGGPTGEIHSIDAQSGALLEKKEELIFLKKGKTALPSADKTRKALRYGAHNVDIGPHNLAYIADVGRNSILIYSYDAKTGSLRLLNEVASPESHDGPRHVVPSWSGKLVFVVTEHTSFVDVFRITASATGSLRHIQRVTVLPDLEHYQTKDYRGDTVRLSPDGKYLFATTRGMTTSQKGFIKVWSIDENASEHVLGEKLVYTARNSGGKAHAIEFAPRYGGMEPSSDFAVFTDDEQGYISVLEWDGTDLQDVATIQLPPLDNGEAQGASQAVWIS